VRVCVRGTDGARLNFPEPYLYDGHDSVQPSAAQAMAAQAAARGDDTRETEIGQPFDRIGVLRASPRGDLDACRIAACSLRHIYWAKRCRASDGWHIRTGYWTRANPGACVLGTRGSPMRLSRSVRRLVVAPVREHSRKSDEVAQSIQQLMPGPYLEMFARERRFGWDAWGNEIEKFSEVPTLLQAA